MLVVAAGQVAAVVVIAGQLGAMLAVVEHLGKDLLAVHQRLEAQPVAAVVVGLAQLVEMELGALLRGMVAQEPVRR